MKGTCYECYDGMTKMSVYRDESRGIILFFSNFEFDLRSIADFIAEYYEIFDDVSIGDVARFVVHSWNLTDDDYEVYLKYRMHGNISDHIRMRMSCNNVAESRYVLRIDGFEYEA